MEKRPARRRLAENLRIIRLLRNWSQEDLAAATGLDRSYIGGLERAERNVGLDVMERLAESLGVTIAELTSEPDPRQLSERILEIVREAVDGTPFRIREECTLLYA